MPGGSFIELSGGKGVRTGTTVSIPGRLLLTRQRLVQAVKEALQREGVEQSKYNGHSFRIGAATTAAVNCLKDSIIKILRRWKNMAYLRYVRIPRDELASYSKLLCA